MNEIAIINSLPQGQAGIDRFSDLVIQEVKEGRSNPLEIHIALKGLEKATKRILSEIGSNVNSERSLYPEKVLSLHGAEISGLTPVSTTYEFGGCNDPELRILQAELENAKEKLKAREDFLKSLTKPETLLDQDTGEYYTVNPPTKKQTNGVKISFK